MDPFLAIALGFVSILLASALEVYCTFGRQARPNIKPGILKSPFRWIMESLWVILLIVGSGMLFLKGWYLAVAGILGFWLILPFILTPIMRYRLLPHWQEVKTELEPKGLNEKNYWREDWWMVEEKQKKLKRKRKK
jgi:hypothetical protein